MPHRRQDLYDLLIALAFVGLVIAPAIVATNSRVELRDEDKRNDHVPR
jgi:hypothetical protein